jgi:rubrerythrin
MDMGSKGLEIHPEKGVNPRMNVCEGCGKDIGVALIGAKENKFACKTCGTIHLSKGRPRKCRVCGPSKFEAKGPLGEHEKIPMGLCEACDKNEREIQETIEKGGIHWRCEDCGSAGAIKEHHPLSAKVRMQTGIKAPDPVGISFNKEDCPLCRGEN